ncbi:uncharacterized protein [Diadema antillarum]|uniref:uncharacterized protein n=1 Tax=Diadema antillarum TaxID=105358 RepID=UPI003A8C6D84
MKSQLDVSNTAVLTAVYSQCWPAPDPNNTPRKGFIGSHQMKSSSPRSTHQASSTNRPTFPVRGNKQVPHPTHRPQGGLGRGVNNRRATQGLCVNGMRASDRWGFQKDRSEEGFVRSNDLPLHLGLDKGTLHWRSWSHFKQDLNTQLEEEDLSLYKITQDTFRKLTQQVTEASLHLNGRYGSTGFQGVRRSQLAANLPSSHPSIQNHREASGEMEKFQADLAIQCTPFKERKKQRPKSHMVSSRRRRLSPPPRPHSTLGMATNLSDVRRFDQLSPNVIHQLQGDGEYGREDGTSLDGECSLGPYDIVNDDYKLDESDSDLGVSEDLHSLVSDEVEQSERRSIGSMDMDSSEDEEEIRERMERMRRHREKMKKKLMRLDLPPEVLSGNIDCMFPYSGSSAAKKKRQDPFADALSEPYCHMDLLELSMMDKDWRTIIRTAPDADDAALMERMIEMEKLQYQTAEWESQQSSPKRRSASALGLRKGWNDTAAIPTERAHSALAKPKQSKNCCEECLQLVCAGDCPNKNAAGRGLCIHCRQPYCNGVCTEFGYHLHIRHARQEEKKKRRPKSCHTCRRSKTPNNTINTNNIILGRPRSGFATYSSSRVQSARANRMTVASTEGAEHVSDRMEKLGLSARKYADKSGDEGEDEREGKSDKKARPRTAGSRRQIRGRDALIAGKSFQSQRRFSLTEEPVSTTAASMNPRILRVRSAHYRTRKARQKGRKVKKK